MRKLSIISWLAIAISSSSALAQSTDDCVQFDEALQIALDVNPRIESALAERDIASAGLMGALSQSRPQVLLFAQAGQGDGRLQNNQRDNQVGIQVQQSLYNFGATRYSQLSAKEQLRAAEYSVTQRKVDAAQEIGTAYLESLRANAVLALSIEQEDYYLQDALSADDRLKAQAITISDASAIKASAAVATSQRIDATLIKDQAKTRLAILLDYDPIYACTSANSLIQYTEDSQDILGSETLDSLLDYAAKNTAQIKQTQSRIRAARASTEQSRRASLPNVTLQGFLSYEEEQPGFFGQSSDEWLTRDRVGINISSPLYTGGAGKARVDDARARLRGANSDLAAIRAAQEENLSRLWVRSKAQEATLASLAQARDNYKIQLENIKAEYRIGTRTLTDVIRAAEDYYSTASNEINTRHQYYNNLFLLRTSVFGITK